MERKVVVVEFSHIGRMNAYGEAAPGLGLQVVDDVVAVCPAVATNETVSHRMAIH
jgi:hypothetical protein